MTDLKRKLDAWADDVCRNEGGDTEAVARAMLDLLYPMTAAADELISHYTEEKRAVEEHRQRIVHLSSERMLAVYDALAELEGKLDDV